MKKLDVWQFRAPGVNFKNGEGLNYSITITEETSPAERQLFIDKVQEALNIIRERIENENK
jgi:hypothetical protein